MSDTNYSKFIDLALRTESQFPEVLIRKELFERTLKVAIAAGELTDIIKKKVAYNKPYDMDTWNGFIDTIIENAQALKLTDQIELDFKQNLNLNPRLFHGTIGLATEGTELLQALLEAYQSGEWDIPNLKEELGDQAWYTAILVDELGRPEYQGILDRVIEKLAKRYPDKYTDQAAINRDLDAERQILER